MAMQNSICDYNSCMNDKYMNLQQYFKMYGTGDKHEVDYIFMGHSHRTHSFIQVQSILIV